MTNKYQISMTSLRWLSRLNLILSPKAHPSQPRVKYPGVLVQMDASHLRSISMASVRQTTPSPLMTVAVVWSVRPLPKRKPSAATTASWSKFSATTSHPPRSWLIGALCSIIACIKKEDSPSTENPLTKFGYTCKKLATELAVTSILQAKGRV